MTKIILGGEQWLQALGYIIRKSGRGYEPPLKDRRVLEGKRELLGRCFMLYFVTLRQPSPV
jgi:hypothetical protein